MEPRRALAGRQRLEISLQRHASVAHCMHTVAFWNAVLFTCCTPTVKHQLRTSSEGGPSGQDGERNAVSADRRSTL